MQRFCPGNLINTDEDYMLRAIKSFFALYEKYLYSLKIFQKYYRLKIRTIKPVVAGAKFHTA